MDNNWITALWCYFAHLKDSNKPITNSTPKKKVAFFTGAGISVESGLHTYRDKDGLWNNYPVAEVATFDAIQKDSNKVNNFFNSIRRNIMDANPNKAHQAIKSLETDFNVTIITQNVDDLHERAGSDNIIHLHGEILKSRPMANSIISYEQTKDIEPDEKCMLTGSKLRPSVVLFGEQPLCYQEALEAVKGADIIVVVGSSLKVNPAAMLVTGMLGKKPIYVIDPNPELLKDLDFPKYDNLVHIVESASTGMEAIKALIYKNLQGS